MIRFAPVPSLRETAAAARHTGLLLRLRWRQLRGTAPRILVGVGIAALIGVLFLASNVGVLIRRFAQDGMDTTVGQYAVNYLLALQGGELGGIAAMALGSAMLAALFGPFTGSAGQALAAADDLAGLRPNRLHRFFDSLVTTGVSTIGFLQLLTLTAVASLLTLDGGRIGALLLTWALWPALVLATVAEGWALELVHRALGKTARRAVGLGLLAVIVAAVALDPHHGRTLFGVGTAFGETLREAGAGNVAYIAAALAVLAGQIVVLFIAGLVLCRTALAYPAVPSGQSKDRRPLIPMSRHPKVALAQVLVAQMIRTPEVRRPILTILIIGVPGAWLAGANRATLTTLVVAVPLAVALSWGANAFGILGPGMTWLASQPNVMRWLIWMTGGLQVATTAVIAGLCWAPPALLGRVNGADVLAVAAATAVSTVVTSRSATAKAVNRPFLARLGARGDVTLPPLTAINYTLRFTAWGGAAGVLLLNYGDSAVQVGLAAIAVCYSAGRFVFLVRRWRDREHQAMVVATVAPA